MKNKELKEFIYNNVYQNASNGYVLTPSELAFEMVSTLPKSVFQSDSTTFLDPICKSGTFLFEIVEKLYAENHPISNIEKRIYTIDGNSHSLNVAQSYIRKILNKESGSFKFDYKYDFVEKFYNRLIALISKGKFTTLESFLNIIIIDKKEKHLMELLKNSISDFISKYEKVSKLESKLFGEVFTPRQLIDEMLDTLPESVWKNPDLKWLDPAVGIGNFPAAILDRLMVGLDSVIPNEDDRRKHILEEMLYVCDISTKNLFLLYMLFDKNNEFKLNVYRGSFLSEDFDKHMKEVWKLDGFDVVVGNPPYQDVSDKVSGTTGKKNLYQKFITKILDNILNNNGYLLFVNPPAFLKTTVFEKSTDIFSLFKNRNLVLVNLSDINDKYFKVGSPICYFLLNNSTQYHITKFITDNDETLVNIRNYNFIPRILSKGVLDILDKVSSRGIKFNFKRDARVVKDKFITLKRLNHINRNGRLNSVVGSSTVKFDLTFECEYPDRMCFILDSPLYRFLNYTLRHDGVIYHYFMNGLTYPDSYELLYTYESIYDYYDITQEEIDLIEKTIKD